MSEQDTQRADAPEVTPSFPELHTLFQATDPKTGRVVFEIALSAGRPVLRLSDTAGRLWFEMGPYMAHRMGDCADAPTLRVFNPHTGRAIVEVAMLGDDGHNSGYVNVNAADGCVAGSLQVIDHAGNLHLADVSQGHEETKVELRIDKRRGGELELVGGKNDGSLRLGLT
jgi:hypothetical protein